MDNRDRIIEKANELGHLLQQNDIVNRYIELSKALEESEASQKLLQGYLETMQALIEKEKAGQPIEPAEKKQIQELEEQVRADEILGDFLATQAYYGQLMDGVNVAIANPQGEPPKESNIITPGEASNIILPK